MAYTVTIKYNGFETDLTRCVASIANVFVPTSSYVDTLVFEEG